MPTKRKILLLPCSSGETAVQRPSTNCFLIKHFQNKIPTSRNTTLLKSCVFFQEIIKCQSCMSKHLQMLAVSINILLQWWVFLLLLKAVKNKLRAKNPREFERARYLFQRQQLSCLLSILRCWGGRKAFMKKNTTKKHNPSHKTSSCWGCPAQDLWMHRGLAQWVTSSAVHWSDVWLHCNHPTPKGGSDTWQGMEMRNKPQWCQSGLV